MRKCCRMFTRPDWGKTSLTSESLLWCSGQHPCLVFILKSGPPLVCKAVNGFRGSHLALVCLAVVTVISAKIENVKHAASAFIFGVCDDLGTPSLPPFCHNNVWMWACVTRITNLRCHVLDSWISMIVSCFKSLTGNRRTWIERPGIIGHRSSRLMWSGGERTVRMAHYDPPINPRLLIWPPRVCEGRPVLGDKLG